MLSIRRRRGDLWGVGWGGSVLCQELWKYAKVSLDTAQVSQYVYVLCRSRFRYYFGVDYLKCFFSFDWLYHFDGVVVSTVFVKSSWILEFHCVHALLCSRCASVVRGVMMWDSSGLDYLVYVYSVRVSVSILVSVFCVYSNCCRTIGLSCVDWSFVNTVMCYFGSLPVTLVVEGSYHCSVVSFCVFVGQCVRVF